jgi:propanol-preferring alcohol dehydrogenase
VLTRLDETLCLAETYTAVHVNGCYAQYPVVKAQWAIKLPDNVPFEQLAPFMCSGGTAYTAVKATECKAGQSVVVFGAGGGVGEYERRERATLEL